MYKLSQFVPQKVCLSCDGCCRFDAPNSPWRPKITPEEIFLKERDKDGYLKAVKCQKQIQCVFLDAKDNRCHVYAHRPFECRLYPFLLIKRGDGAAVSVHLGCPYVQEKWESQDFEQYAGYLKQFFQRKDVLDFIRRNKSLLGAYKGYEEEIKEIFTVAL